MKRNLIKEIAAKTRVKEEGLGVTLSRIKKREDLRSIEQAACYYIKKNNLDINVSSIMDDVTRAAVQGFKQRPIRQSGTAPIATHVQKTVRTRGEKRTRKAAFVSPDLTFVQNDALRSMLQRDIDELNIAISAGIDKTRKICMVMAGSIAETLLLEKLMQDSQQASSVAHTQKVKHPEDLDRWELGEMVRVATQMNPPLLPTDLITLADQVREWRNLIHPGRELRDARNKEIEISKGRANAAVSVLQIIEEHLNKPKK
ncbi:MAG: hypothetical protein EYC68_03345 [Chloroflexota bacterium]|nr:MAG: hypothetical protein EYC68_03345 [Chloroflexota bacterium]